MSPRARLAGARGGLVGFVVGEVAYAVPIVAVREVVAATALTALPHAPHDVAGVMDHRGEVVVMLDLRVRFGLPKTRDPRRARWILLVVEGRTLGLISDSVLGVLSVAEGELKPPPVLGAGDLERGVVGVVSVAGRMIFVLDVLSFEHVARSVPPSTPPRALEGRP